MSCNELERAALHERAAHHNVIGLPCLSFQSDISLAARIDLGQVTFRTDEYAHRGKIVAAYGVENRPEHRMTG